MIPLGDLRATTPIRVQERYHSSQNLPFAELRPGDYMLHSDLYNGLDPMPVEVNIKSDRETIVTLEVPDGMVRGTVTGRAVDGVTGRPLSGVVLNHSQPHAVTMGIHLGADGKFEFKFVAETVEVYLKRDGYHETNVTIDVGNGENPDLGDVPMDRL